jgi:RNA polymerase sigma factor (sigma-70 family)
MNDADSQSLLAGYAKTGSDATFRELVQRYTDLVYSAAVRLVGNDTDLAKDVTQTVFLALARKARTLPPGVMLGGWLHHHTFYVASRFVRTERRRQARERQAMEMNACPDHTEENLARIAPVLDEAIDRLGREDRTAILLRFFEQRDFSSVARALGSTEETARKRVSRALEKLHLLLKHRGVSLSAAALGTALASEAVTAAPAGLALGVAGTALAGAAAGGTPLTVLNLINMTTLKLGLLAAIVVGGVVIPLVIQHHSMAELRLENQALREQAGQIADLGAENADLQAENQRLSNLVAQAASGSSSADGRTRELLRLRGEVGMLRVRTNELAGLREKGRRRRAAPITDQAGAKLSDAERRAKLLDAEQLVQGLIKQAQDNGQQLATGLTQIEPYLGGSGAKAFTGTNQFELVFQGSLQDIKTPHEIIVIRESQLWKNPHGGWARVYGFADGSACAVAYPDPESFESYEKDHMLPAAAAQ